jgi:hypothetical protein
LADDLASIAKGMIEEYKFNRVLAAATSIGRDFIP